VKFKYILIFSAIISLIVGLGEFFPYQLTNIFPNNIFVDNSDSVGDINITKAGTKIFYFSSSINQSRDTGSKQVSDIEFVLRNAIKNKYHEITIVSDFNETIGSSLNYLKNKSNLVVNSVLVNRLARPAIASVVSPNCFASIGNTKIWVSLQGIAFNCKLILRIDGKKILTKDVNLKTQLEFPLDFAVRKLTDVKIDVELLFANSILSKQSIILHSPFQKNIVIEGLKTPFLDSLFYDFGLKPVYKKFDFNSTPSAVLIFNPDSDSWNKKRTKELQSFIMDGGKAIGFINKNFLLKKNNLKSIFAVSASEKLKQEHIDILIDTTLQSLSIATIKQLNINGSQVRRFYWDGKTLTRSLIKTSVTDNISMVKGITKLLNMYRKENNIPHRLFVFSAQSKDKAIVPAPINALPITMFLTSLTGKYIKDLQNITKVKVLPLPVNKDVSINLLQNNIPEHNLKMVKVLSKKKDVNIYAFDLKILNDASVVLRDKNSGYPLLLKTDIGAGKVFTINLQSKLNKGLILRRIFKVLGNKKVNNIVGAHIDVSLHSGNFIAKSHLPFKLKINQKIYIANKVADQFIVTIPTGLIGVSNISLFEKNMWRPFYIVCTQVDAESTFKAANISLAKKIAKITGGYYYPSIDKWLSHKYLFADARHFLRQIALIITFMSVFGLIFLNLKSKI